MFRVCWKLLRSGPGRPPIRPVDSPRKLKHERKLEDELTKAEIRELRRGTRRRRRLWAGVILGNLAVLGLMVGGPFLRARQRALEGRRDFGRFVACLWGGRPTDSAGLVLPSGDRAHYVDAFMAREDWPRHCLDELDAVAPTEAFWIFPETRHAEGEVRRAVAMVRRELRDVNRDDSVVPSRPWLGVQRLVAALTLWCEQADALTHLQSNAVTCSASTSVIPERLPFRTTEKLRMWLRPLGDGAEAFGIDQRGVSWLRVGGGRVRPQRVRRPPALSDWLVRGPEIWLVWKTPDERCREQSCANRAMGLAQLRESDATAPPPHWYGAHPAGPVKDTVRLNDHRLTVIAVGPESRYELRHFELRDTMSTTPVSTTPAIDSPATSNPATGTSEPANVAPAAPTERIVLPEGLRSPIFDEAGHIIGLNQAGLVQVSGSSFQLLHPATATTVRRCGDYYALVDDDAIVVGHVAVGDDSANPSRAIHPTPVEATQLPDARSPTATTHFQRAAPTSNNAGSAATEAFDADAHAQEASHSWVRIATSPNLVLDCNDGGAIFATNQHAVLCRRGQCTTHRYDAPGHLAAVMTADAAVVAHGEPERQIYVRRVDENGIGAPQIPAGCWSAEGGLCGQPILGARRSRVVLGAIVGDDLAVVETNDGGTSWEPLTGLR